MKFGAVVCSRPQSRRLHRKVFQRAGGASILEMIEARLMRAGVERILAIPRNSDHADIHEYKKNWMGHIEYGDSDSPLHRLVEVAEKKRLDYVVRITHDDPLIDDISLREMMKEVEANEYGYAVTSGIVDGAGFEIISTENLIRAAERHQEPTEYVSYFVRGKGLPNESVFRYKPRDTVRRDYRLTIDYPEDLTLLQIVMSRVGAGAPLDKVAAYLDKNPHLLQINKLPLVSFYTCMKDAEKFVGATVSSVRNSGLHDYEHLIVDDGSTDDSVSEALRSADPSRVKLILNDENVGLASSSNKAISEARGHYIMRVDADDLIIPGSVESLVEKARAASAAVVYPAYRLMDEGANLMNGVVSPSKDHHAGCALMDRNMINEVRFTDGIRHWDSLDLYKRLDGRFPVVYHNTPTWLYRRHGGNMSNPSPEREASKP